MAKVMPPEILSEFAPGETLSLHLAVLKAWGFFCPAGMSISDLLDEDRLFVYGRPENMEIGNWRNLYRSFNKFPDTIKIGFIDYVVGIA